MMRFTSVHDHSRGARSGRLRLGLAFDVLLLRYALADAFQPFSLRRGSRYTSSSAVSTPTRALQYAILYDLRLRMALAPTWPLYGRVALAACK